MESSMRHVEREELVSASRKGTRSDLSFLSVFLTPIQQCLLSLFVVTLLFAASSTWAAQDWEAKSKKALLQEDWGKVVEIATQWKATGFMAAGLSFLPCFISTTKSTSSAKALKNLRLLSEELT